MRFLIGFTLIFLLIAIQVSAQFNYVFQNDVQVTENDVELTLPFSGGFIAPQFNTIDLNNDGDEDLVVFERASNKISTFLYLNDTYTYAPEYESDFPSASSWMLLRDYNCDGKKDIFTSSLFGMSLYENNSTTTGLSWTLKEQTIYTEGSSGQINLQVSSYDLPAISDVDGDGDLDILNFNFAVGGGIEFHKNMSVENTGSCGLELVRMTKRYGEFEECTCDEYVFGTDECVTSGGRLTHSGGKSILSFDAAGNGVQDIIVGQEYCVFPGYLENVGTASVPMMQSVNFDFPVATDPLRMEYPAFFELDVDHDGINDLMAAPNKYQPDGTIDYTSLITFFKGLGSGLYSRQTDTFLKSEMIDVGYKASPALADIDFDGDEDMLIGTGKIGNGATIWFYKNTGSTTNPSFELTNTDYLGLSSEQIESIRLQFLDVNEDSNVDLVVYKVKDGTLSSIIYLHSGNQSNPYSITNTSGFQLPSNEVWDAPTLFKSGNSFGLLIGKQDGSLSYYILTGSLEAGGWKLVSDTYLDIIEDYTKRNLHVAVADLNANGTLDMLSIDDSGVVNAYENFLSQKEVHSVYGLNGEKTNEFTLGFGKQANPVFANLYNTEEPVLMVGLLQGGVQLLKNEQQTDGSGKLSLKVVSFPNPVEKGMITLQSNKSGTARVVDTMGKQVLDTFTVEAGKASSIELSALPGIYLVEVTAHTGEKSTSRIVVVN